MADIAWNDATYVSVGKSTSSPGPIPQACKAKCNAEVPVLTQTLQLHQ